MRKGSHVSVSRLVAGCVRGSSALAATLTLAGVLPLASVLLRLAAALAFAGVLPLASVLAALGIVELLCIARAVHRRRGEGAARGRGARDDSGNCSCHQNRDHGRMFLSIA